MSDPTARPNADEEWENLLRQLPSHPVARPRPYFYGRVRARLAHQLAAERAPVRSWLYWPAYAAMLGALLLLSGDDAALRSAGGARPANTSAPAGGFSGEFYRLPGR